MAEIFGTDIFEAGKDLIKALLDALITDMASDDPKVSAAYDYPNIVNPTFNAVSVHILDAEALDSSDFSQSSLGTDVLYNIRYSIRVHIDHANGSHDHDKIARLLNSVNNKLHKNKNLGSKFRIQYTTNFKFTEVFTESDTLGGELECLVYKFASHSQE